MILDVAEGGLLTSVQDAGRPDWTHLGVPESGATDAWSLAVANLLLGNDPGAAAIEITLGGARFVARQDGTIALAGANLGARVADGRRLAVGRTHWLAAGDELAFDGPAGPASVGSRCYVAVPGGVDVPLVLGSRSTCLPGGFGGHDGRRLRAGDTIRSGRSESDSRRRDVTWPGEPAVVRGDDDAIEVRAIAGPANGFDALVAGSWRVSAASDRVGLRLEGTALVDGIGGEALTHGVARGSIQVPPDGRPIVLSADHQTTGGYRVVGGVISADLPIVGQLGPGARVRFVGVTLDEADAALIDRNRALEAGAAALREGPQWDHLVASAGG